MCTAGELDHRGPELNRFREDEFVLSPEPHFEFRTRPSDSSPAQIIIDDPDDEIFDFEG